MGQTKDPGHALGMSILFALNDSSLYKFKTAVKNVVWSCNFTCGYKGIAFNVLSLMPRLSDCNNLT